MSIYVYRHIRLDKNEPFYIGIGNEKRPYTKSGRNKIWNDIVKKTEYRVEILFEGLSWNEACEKEREFIKLYGRIDLKTGTLSNLTDGGDGVENLTNEAKEKIRKGSLGLKRSNETRAKQSLIKINSFKDKNNHPSFGKKRPDADRLKNIAVGRKWYTNGEIDKMCYPGTEPDGFKPGRNINKIK